MSAGVSSYTFHSATQSPAVDALETLPAFRGFERAYLQPLLQRPPSAALWLDPLLEPTCALVAWLVNPSPLPSQPPILLGSDRRPGRALAAYAGPHLAAVWWPALEQARALLQGPTTPTGKQSQTARFAAVAFPAVGLAVAVHAVRLVPGGRRPAQSAPPHPAPMPPRRRFISLLARNARARDPPHPPPCVHAGGACLLLFYELPLQISGTSSPEDGKASASVDTSDAVQLPEESIPQASGQPAHRRPLLPWSVIATLSCARRIFGPCCIARLALSARPSRTPLARSPR